MDGRWAGLALLIPAAAVVLLGPEGFKDWTTTTWYRSRPEPEHSRWWNIGWRVVWFLVSAGVCAVAASVVILNP